MSWFYVGDITCNISLDIHLYLDLINCFTLYYILFIKLTKLIQISCFVTHQELDHKLFTLLYGLFAMNYEKKLPPGRQMAVYIWLTFLCLDRSSFVFPFTVQVMSPQTVFFFVVLKVKSRKRFLKKKVKETLWYFGYLVLATYFIDWLTLNGQCHATPACESPSHSADSPWLTWHKLGGRKVSGK